MQPSASSTPSSKRQGRQWGYSGQHWQGRCPTHSPSLPGSTSSCGDTARGEGVAGPRFGMATSCLTPCWTLLQNNTALREAPKVAAVEKEAPSHACTHRLCHRSQHRLGQPHTVLEARAEN